jgi:hypothetical protein
VRKFGNRRRGLSARLPDRPVLVKGEAFRESGKRLVGVKVRKYGTKKASVARKGPTDAVATMAALRRQVSIGEVFRDLWRWQSELPLPSENV